MCLFYYFQIYFLIHFYLSILLYQILVLNHLNLYFRNICNFYFYIKNNLLDVVILLRFLILKILMRYLVFGFLNLYFLNLYMNEVCYLVSRHLLLGSLILFFLNLYLILNFLKCYYN